MMPPKSTSDNSNSPFAVNLRELMASKKVSQQQLATAISKTRQTVSQYINGVSEPGYTTLAQIADFFNVSVDYLLGVSSAKSTDTTVQDIVRITGLNEESILKLIAWNSLQAIACKPQSDLTEYETEVLNAANLYIKHFLWNPDTQPHLYAQKIYINLVNNLIRAINECPQEACKLYESFIHSLTIHHQIRNGAADPLPFEIRNQIRNQGYQILGPKEASDWYLSLLFDGIKYHMNENLDWLSYNWVEDNT